MTELVENAEEFVLRLFKKELPKTFIYHNFRHTQRVVKSTKELIDNSEIAVKQQEAVLLAAWLHDTGYTVTYKGHEEESAKIAREFLERNHANEELQKDVLNCIKATEFKAIPEDDLQKIIKDADTSHIAKDYFEETSEFLRQELKLQHQKNFSASEWIEKNVELFTKEHKFFTAYAIKNWQKKKDENLLTLLEKKQKINKKIEKEDKKARLKEKYRNENPERSIQTLFRVTMRNHLKLSDIADAKANILLSVNAIIISLAIANLIPKMSSPTDREIMIPILVLVIFSVASIIGSILSTRPSVTSGEFTKEQVEKRKVNVLFFGNFHRMPYDQFKWAMNEIIEDKDFVYESLMKDLYLLGVVLNKKYRLLRITYNIFMVGIILSVLSFVVTFYLI